MADEAGQFRKFRRWNPTSSAWRSVTIKVICRKWRSGWALADSTLYRKLKEFGLVPEGAVADEDSGDNTIRRAS